MKLSVWLKAQGKTQTAFAEELGSSQSYIAQLCKGDKWPGRQMAERIRDATRGMVSADDFLEPPEAAQ